MFDVFDIKNNYCFLSSKIIDKNLMYDVIYYDIVTTNHEPVKLCLSLRKAKFLFAKVWAKKLNQ